MINQLVKRALISVSNKDCLVLLGRFFSSIGYEIISTSSTASLFQQWKIPVIQVSEYTGSPEILGGRVKTLHPKVFAGILAKQTPEHLEQIQMIKAGLIDLVVVNLYPFAQTISKPDVALAEAIEQIDIGGPSLLRAAAKNYERVAVVCDPNDYKLIISEIQNGGITPSTREQLALKAFQHTAHYDATIASFLEWQFNGATPSTEVP
jgi:phosphoribosylaminoimidazolecarboxamide formyltransferase/IMP cyclohydrolase